MLIKKIHTLWPERQGFHLEFNHTENYYVFLHFLSDVKLRNGEKIHSGACILYKPFSYRYFLAEKEPLIHDWFHANGNFEELMSKYGLDFNTFYYPNNDKEITRIMHELELETLTPSNFANDVFRLKTEELLLTIARGIAHPLRVDSDTHERFVHLRTYIQTNFHQIQNVEDLSKMVCLSPSRFYTTYKMIFDISPKQDLLNIRIEHAKVLLRQRHYTVSEVAELVGYTNQYHFIRQFKIHTGITPLQYSKK